jgi:flagellar protein FliO/FliZ
MKLLIVFIGVLWPAFAGAAGFDSENLLPASLKLIGALALVLGLVLLLYYFSRKGFGFLPSPRSGAIKVLEVKHLMPKKSLFLVEVHGRQLLLGVGIDRIELLSDLEWCNNKANFEETLSQAEEKQ